MGKKSNPRKAPGPPEGAAWVWLTEFLICSDAWRSQSINCRRLVEFLLREHMAHGGQENGHLVAPYKQLEAWGIGHHHISPAVREAEQKGLTKVERGALRGRAMKADSRYTLTFLPARGSGHTSSFFAWPQPTNEWTRYRLRSKDGMAKDDNG